MSSVNTLKEAPASVRITVGVLESLAIAVGLTGTVLCLMSVASAFVSNLWGQLVPALLIGVGAPLLTVERLSHDHRGRLRLRLAAEILSLLWLGFTIIYIVVAFPTTRASLLREATMLEEGGAPRAAALVTWMARGGAEVVSEDRDMGFTPSTLSVELDADVSYDATLSDGENDASVDAEVAPPESLYADGDQRPWVTLGEVRRQLAPSLVTISVLREDRTTRTGTGFVVRPDIIATAGWVVEDYAAAAVRFSNGRWIAATTLTNLDDDSGIALLSVPEQLDSLPVAIGDATELRGGEALAIIGNSLGIASTIETGTLEEVAEREGRTTLVVSAVVSLSNVGGPIVTRRGLVVGIAVPPGGNGEWPDRTRRSSVFELHNRAFSAATSHELVTLLRREPQEPFPVVGDALLPPRW